MTNIIVSEEAISEALALRTLVKAFICDNKIRSAESVYQKDCVVENSLDFIESLCEVAGYYDEDD